jgi:hypothetical protein
LRSERLSSNATLAPDATPPSGLARSLDGASDPASADRAEVPAAEAGLTEATVAAETARPTEASAAHDRVDVMRLLLDGAKLRQTY